MPARAAGQEHHALARRLSSLGGRAQLLEMDLALVEADPPEQRVAHRARLLVDLLQHEVAVAALLGLHRVPGDALGRPRRPRRPVASVMRHRVGRDRHDLAVVQEEEVAGVGQEGRDVGGEEVLAFAEAHDQRRPEARADQGLRLVLVQEHEGVDPLELADGLAHRVLEGALVVVGHEVGDHLGVGLGHEACGPPPARRAFRAQVVLDDAVVDDHDAARGSPGAGWAFSSVGRPWVAQRVWPMP